MAAPVNFSPLTLIMVSIGISTSAIWSAGRSPSRRATQIYRDAQPHAGLLAVAGHVARLRSTKGRCQLDELLGVSAETTADIAFQIGLEENAALTGHGSRRPRKGLKRTRPMPINADKPHLWKQDIAASVDQFNRWFTATGPRCRQLAGAAAASGLAPPQRPTQIQAMSVERAEPARCHRS
jgi:hypothetical protein